MSDEPQLEESQALELGENAEDFAAGLFELLAPGVTTCDAQVQQVLESQLLLRSEIDRLETELAEFAEAGGVPSLTPYTTKLVNSRQRIGAINAKLVRVDKRLESIRAMVLKRESGRKNKQRGGASASAEAVPDRRSLSIAQYLNWDKLDEEEATPESEEAASAAADSAGPAKQKKALKSGARKVDAPPQLSRHIDQPEVDAETAAELSELLDKDGSD